MSIVGYHTRRTRSDPSLNARFDLVGFDPRGVGASTPSLRCETDAQRTPIGCELAGHQPQAPRPRSTPRTIAPRPTCRVAPDVSGVNGVPGKDFLANVGTVTVAKDVDVLRGVLGDPKLTYVGWSYGTSIGTQYAEQFPTNVRALILDGAVDPNQSSSST